MNTHPIRRYSNGAIDIDFYRQRALSERAAVRTGAGWLIGPGMRTVIAAVRHLARTPVRVRTLPDPGTTMLRVQAATRRPPI
jgi:hypothetical protein